MNEAAVSTETPSARRTSLCLALLALAILGAVPPTTPWFLRLLPAVLAAGACILSARRARSVLAPATLVLGITALMAASVLWQISLALALAGAGLTRRYVEDSTVSPIRRGRVPLRLTLFAGLVTPGALIGWVILLQPDVSDLVDVIPKASLWLLALGGAIFALANATLEEFVWRGILQPKLTAEFGLAWAISLQALSFGIAHAHGFPRGLVGIALAGSWAVVLGVLRHVASGLLAPIVAHVVADSTIACIVIWLSRA